VPGPVGILCDPPYAQDRRQARLYATEDDCAGAVREWAIAHGEDRRLRIALCGLDGEHVMPDTWTAHPWQARGGLQNTKHHGRGSGETRQEVVWFSPHCLQAAQLDLLRRDAVP
jgi:DNA adenine methylase